MTAGPDSPAAFAQQGERRRRRLGLALTLALAAGIRLITWQQIDETPIWYLQRWTQSDMSFYDGWARAILAGDVWSASPPRPYHGWHEAVARDAHRLSGSTQPFDKAVARRLWDGWLGEKTFYQAPLYAYFLAAVYTALGDSPGSVFAVQALLGSGTAALVFWLALRLFGTTVALVAGPLAALYGPLVLYDFVLLRTGLAALLGIATVLAAGTALASPERRGPALAAGALAGLSVLLRVEALLFAAGLAVLGVGLWRRQRRRLAPQLAAGLCGFALALVPLAARNLLVGAPLLGVAATGAVTFVNHNAVDYTDGRGDFTSAHAARILTASGGRFGPAVVATLATHAHPSTVLASLGRKLYAFWHWYEIPNNVNYYYFLLFARGLRSAGVTFALVAPLALVGIALASRRLKSGEQGGDAPAPGAVPLAASALIFIGAGLVTSLAFYNLSRFRAPFAAALIPFAALTLVEIARWARARRSGPAALAVGAVAALAIVLLGPLPAGVPLVQIADYGVSNELALQLASRRLACGERTAALALLERQLATEPEELRTLRPGPSPSSLSLLSARLAGSFAPLHELAARLYEVEGRPRAATGERWRARVLRRVSEQLAGREGGDSP